MVLVATGGCNSIGLTTLAINFLTLAADTGSHRIGDESVLTMASIPKGW